MYEAEHSENGQTPISGSVPSPVEGRDANPGATPDTDFLVVVAHELKGPLTNIGGYTQLLLRQPNIAEERRLNYLQVILDETRRLSRLVNDLVDATEFEGGRIDITTGPTSPASLITAGVERARRVIPTGQIEIHDFAVPDAVWDGVRIEDAIFHLITNAWRHAAGSEPAQLAVQCDGERVLIQLLDRGPGIPEQVQPIVTTPYFRFPREAGGRKVKGLGLFLTRSIAEAHGGELRLRPRPGGGTIAEIELPLRAR